MLKWAYPPLSKILWSKLHEFLGFLEKQNKKKKQNKTKQKNRVFKIHFWQRFNTKTFV